MNGIVELAKMLKERENSSEKLLIIGSIVSLPDIKIKIGEKIILSASDVKTTVNLSERDDNGNYINLGKETVILNDSGKFYVLGVLQ